MASTSKSSSRNSDSETELYSDIVCLDGVESEVLERCIETDPRSSLCNHTLPLEEVLIHMKFQHFREFANPL